MVAQLLNLSLLMKFQKHKMKTKNEIIREAYTDIMYSTKTITEVLEEVYEYAYEIGVKQGNENKNLIS